MSAETYAAFDEIVLRGACAQSGMPVFAGKISESDAAILHACNVDLAWRAWKATP